MVHILLHFMLMNRVASLGIQSTSYIYTYNVTLILRILVGHNKVQIISRKMKITSTVIHLFFILENFIKLLIQSQTYCVRKLFYEIITYVYYIFCM